MMTIKQFLHDIVLYMELQIFYICICLKNDAFNLDQIDFLEKSDY